MRKSNFSRLVHTCHGVWWDIESVPKVVSFHAILCKSSLPVYPLQLQAPKEQANFSSNKLNTYSKPEIHPDIHLSKLVHTCNSVWWDILPSLQVWGHIWLFWPVLLSKRTENPSYCCEWLVGVMKQTRHPSTILWHPYKTHTTSESCLAIPICLGPYLALLACFSVWRARNQSYCCEWLVGVIKQIRHPSTTLWHPYKTHTTSESCLATPTCLGQDLALLAGSPVLKC